MLNTNNTILFLTTVGLVFYLWQPWGWKARYFYRQRLINQIYHGVSRDGRYEIPLVLDEQTVDYIRRFDYKVSEGLSANKKIVS